MNPSDDDQQRDDLNDNLFPEANQRLTSHDFYSQRPTNTGQQSPYPASNAIKDEHFDYATSNVAEAYDANTNSDEAYAAETEEYCPECDAPLVVKEGTLSNYIACSRFPECKFTKPYDDAPNQSYAQPQHYEDENGDPYTQDNSDRYYDKHTDSTDDYGEPSHTTDEQNYEEKEEVAQSPEHAEGLPYYEDKDSAISDEDEPSHDNFQPSIYGQTQKDEPWDKQDETAVTHHAGDNQTKTPSHHVEELSGQTERSKDRPLLLDHPVFIDKKDAIKSAKWVELKQKRLMDQKIMAGVSPLAPGEDMPDPAELEETLKKLESNVANLQTQDQLQSSKSQLNPHRAQLNDSDDNYYSD